MPPDFVDLWGWYDRFYDRAVEEEDEDRQQFASLFESSWPEFERSPREALSNLQQGRRLAAQLGEKCWTAFFDYWQCEVYLFFIANYKAALDLAVRNAVEVRGSAYDECPVRPRIFRVLVDTYLHIDPVGYEQQIRENLDYLENQPVDVDTWRLLEARRASLAVELERWPEALAATQRYTSRSGSNEFRLIHAHYLFCKIAYEQGQYEAANQHALEGEKYARREDRQRSVAMFQLWQALFARQAGDEVRSVQLWRAALSRAGQTESALGSFYEILADYYVLCGDIRAALDTLDRQYAEAEQSGSAYEMADVRLERCRILVNHELPADDELRLARDAAARTLKPDWFLNRLDALKPGSV